MTPLGLPFRKAINWTVSQKLADEGLVDFDRFMELASDKLILKVNFPFKGIGGRAVRRILFILMRYTFLLKKI